MNIQRLEEKATEVGFTLKGLACKIGIDPKVFLCDGSEITILEAENISAELKLSKKECCEIFLDQSSRISDTSEVKQ